MVYKKVPAHLWKIISLLYREHVEYCLFKCEHIFNGANKNLDILFKSDADFSKACTLLQKTGFVLYLPETVEKFKRMYVLFDYEENILAAVHLHREVAWHGVRALDKRLIFSRQKELAPGVFVPSREDSLLIHVAHVLFENYRIREKEKTLLPFYLPRNIDWSYITQQLRINGWVRGFHLVLAKFKKQQQPSFFDLFSNYSHKFLSYPSEFLYVSKKASLAFLRHFSMRRKGFVIALIGVHGAGKTTQTRQLLSSYSPLLAFIHSKCIGYYFGWRPFSFFARALSVLFRKQQIYGKVTRMAKREKLSISHEILFIYNYIEYLLRYAFHIYPHLRKGDLIVTDRYFYDVYGLYPYAEKSVLIPLLIKAFPKPDALFVLDADTDFIMRREKASRTYENQFSSTSRHVWSRQALDSQRARYRSLSKLACASIISTQQPIKATTEFIIGKTWRNIVLKTADIPPVC